MTFQHFGPRTVAALCAVLLAAPALAQGETPPPRDGHTAASQSAAHRAAEHQRIRRDREALRSQRQHDEAACYQRFAVEDCLRRVRAGVRDAESRLRQQEIELNDAERREKALERRRLIEEKQQGAASAPPPTSSHGTGLRTPPHAAKEGVATQREQEAAQRAQEQRNRIQQQTQGQAARAAEKEQRAAEARERHARTLQAAQERRARVEKSRAEAQASGRPPAAPLPTASDAR